MSSTNSPAAHSTSSSEQGDQDPHSPHIGSLHCDADATFTHAVQTTANTQLMDWCGPWHAGRHVVLDVGKPASSSAVATLQQLPISKPHPISHVLQVEDMASLCSWPCESSLNASVRDNPVTAPPLIQASPVGCGRGDEVGSTCPVLQISAPPECNNLEEQGQHEEDAIHEEDTGCVTPRAPEHRIPDPPELCPPPPPRKKPRSMISGEPMAVLNRWAGQSMQGGADPPVDARSQMAGLISFFRPPPDLHTYPDCIRALFDR